MAPLIYDGNSVNPLPQKRLVACLVKPQDAGKSLREGNLQVANEALKIKERGGGHPSFLLEGITSLPVLHLGSEKNPRTLGHEPSWRRNSYSAMDGRRVEESGAILSHYGCG
jgi:hypothetical protein